MSDLAVRVDGLGKQYRLGADHQPYTTLGDQLRRWATFQPLRQRSRRPEPFWALKDVSFEVKTGEVVGVIGRNGAGKSTLLKVLSRITEPTEGAVDLHGRVGSLLEVGTGFHPELTGRENIALNGAILGMGRREVRAKFHDIVAFAEVERFIDTPVKHYSSGMYTRLAFAVAAHLEPEILVVDEVLAVGDVAFQKKCMGKMGEVARGGRTVLFVSHNMQAIGQLTTQVVLLEAGRVVFQGGTAEGVARYTAGVFGEGALGQAYVAPPGKYGPHVTAARVVTSDVFGEHVCNRPMAIEFDIANPDDRDGLCLTVQICDDSSRPVCHFWLLDRGAEFRGGSGAYRVRLAIPRLRLYMGRYTLTTWLSDRKGGEQLESVREVCPFEVTMRGIHRDEYDWVAGAMTYWEDGEWAPIAPIPDPGGPG